MLKRGKILRDTSISDGLLFIDGQQYSFKLDSIWKSEVSPKVDMVVKAAFGNGNEISSITAVTDNQLAKEQAALAMLAVKEKGIQLASGVVVKFGIEMLTTMALLILGWFFLNTILIQISSSNSVGITFWQTLAIVNWPAGVMSAFGAGGTNVGGGIYSFLAIIALLAPLAPFFWNRFLSEGSDTHSSDGSILVYKLTFVRICESWLIRCAGMTRSASFMGN